MSNLRILGGLAKGRTLTVPDSARPTGARVRKSLFDLLACHFEQDESFLDLYGGSGAVGLEAASRGFQTTLIERNVAAVRALNANIRQLNLAAQARVLQHDALIYLRQAPTFDVVFVDPPYAQDIPNITEQVLVWGGESGRIAQLLIVQHPIQISPQTEYAGFNFERRDYGSNSLSLYWRA